MAHINLLPWRDARRQQQKKNYLSVLFMSALVALGLCYGVASVLEAMINAQQQRNQFLQQQVQILDAQITKIKDIKEQKKQVEQRMALIEQLQMNRNLAPQILDELAKIVPAGISFQSFSRKSNRLEVTGVSESNNRLSEFMRRLEVSSVFTQGDLSSIVADSEDAISQFKLTFELTPEVAPVMAPLAESKKS